MLEFITTTIVDKRVKLFSFWEKAQRGKGLSIFIKWILIIASISFGGLLVLRRFFYSYGLKKRTKLKAKVVSIGNITVGGTGKTPLVEWLARRAIGKNKKTVILSRGYGGGDEVALLSKKLKGFSILTGKDRVSLGKEAINNLKAELILLDDGFQYWPLERDLEVVTVDSTRPLWEDRLLPAGTLRERVSSLKRAEAIVLARVDSTGSGINPWIEYLKDINPQASIFLSRHRPREFINKRGETRPLSLINDRNLIAFSGIARPEAFEETLKALGGKLLYSFRYPDHHYYTPADLAEIKKIAGEKGLIITTEKDLVRIEDGQLDDRLLALVVEIEFLKDEDRFLKEVLA
jgi:tetraacyldisaccharide 4'-kinase